MHPASWIAFFLLSALAGGRGWSQVPLGEAVDGYLATVSEEAASIVLKDILSRPEATPENLLAVLTARPPLLRGTTSILVPHAGEALKVDVRAPADRSDQKMLPVLLAINWSSPPLDEAVRRGAITAEIAGYKPPQFSDVGRDAHSKVLRAVAYHGGGDPDQLWFTGYSWGGHACWDAVLHRPGLVRGFIGRGGGPRRTMFRLFPNLEGVRALAVCGAQDDPELVWTLREIQRTAGKAKLDYGYWEAPENGHDQPLPGEREAGLDLLQVATLPIVRATKGRVVADGPNVEHPLVRILTVNDAQCAVSAGIRLPPGLSPDAQRRAHLDKMKSAVVDVSWSLAEKGGRKWMTFRSSGVRTAQLFLRAPWFEPGDDVVIKVKNRTVFEGVLRADPATLLEEARRSGDRLRPTLRRVELVF